MKRFGLTPLLVLAALAVAMLVAARYTPYFPGDLPLARAIQAGGPPGIWARAVSRAAYVPWIYGVLAVSALAAFRVAGWRAAAAMALTFFTFAHVEHGLQDLIARPEPSAAVIENGRAAMGMQSGMAQRPGYSMPSGWALLFGSTVGLLGVLAWSRSRGIVRAVYATGCAVVLLAGLVARVSLGADWPSDVIAGYLLAIAVGLGVVALLTSRGSSRKSAGRRSSRPTR